MSDCEKIDYRRSYNEKFYDRIGLYLPKGRNDRPGMKEIWQRAADKENAALGEYIKIAVNEKISRTDAELAAMLFAAEADESPAIRAMRQLGEKAKKNGTANMTLEEINAEIDAVRAERLTQAAREKEAK